MPSEFSAIQPVSPHAAPAAPLQPSERPAAQGGNSLPPERPQAASFSQLADAMAKLGEYARSIGHDLQFTIDAQDGRTIVKVLDSQTKEVIRQIPPEDALRVARHLAEMRQGQLFAERA